MAAATGKEQRDAYARLRAVIGPALTVYCLCAVYDVPFDAEAADGAETWAEYAKEAPEGRTFAEGETDVNAALLAGMDREERWETVWGDGYSENDYRRLDDLYRTMTAQLDAAGGLIDKQQEDTARYCSRLALEREKLIRRPDKDNVAMAKNLDDMIRKNLQDCNMRKADQLPTQKQRLDGFVDAMKKKWGLGAEMTREDVLNVFYAWCKRKKYTMTTDAADHMLLAILKTMAKNADQPEPDDLELAFRMGEYSEEFEELPNEEEEEVYRYRGYVRNEFG